MDHRERRFEEESLEELSALADTAGAEVLDTILQEKRRLDPATLIGRGKLEELSARVRDLGASLVIFDSELTPGQAKNLESSLNKKVVDRSGLILDIFARRARSHEAQIQVELAQLEYFLPRLTRQWTHLSRQEGGIGTRGPGETQLETDRRAVNKRIAVLRRKLDRIELQRETRRSTRRKIQKAALVGYTNAGKSTLINSLTKADVFVEDRLFATLDATIRQLPLEQHRQVLLIDTVGFIRKLPARLVASFRSTLEETREADLLIHVVDLSHPGFPDQMETVQRELKELGCSDKPVLLVGNKVDRLPDRSSLTRIKEQYNDIVFTSALRGLGLNELKEKLLGLLEKCEKIGEVRIPISNTKLISYIHQTARVIRKEYEDGLAVIRFQSSGENYQKILNLATQAKEDNDA